MATDQKPQKNKVTISHTNIAWMSMLVWLIVPFYDLCGFWSVAVNSVYKLQFTLSCWKTKLLQTMQ